MKTQIVILTKLLILFILLMILNPAVSGQSIQLQVNGGHAGHYPNIEEGDRLLLPEVPSIGVFFDDGLVAGANLILLYNDLSEVNNSPFLSIVFEHSNLKTILNQDILGHELNINNIGLLAGYKFNPFHYNNVYVSFSIGYIRKFFEGRTDLGNNFYTKNKYSGGSSIRGAAEIELTGIINAPVGIGLSLSYELGTIRRGDIEFYNDSVFLGKLIPTGDKVLPDNIFTMKLTLSFLIGMN